MYDDEKNLYHYTYRKNNNSVPQPELNPQPVTGQPQPQSMSGQVDINPQMQPTTGQPGFIPQSQPMSGQAGFTPQSQPVSGFNSQSGFASQSVTGQPDFGNTAQNSQFTRPSIDEQLNDYYAARQQSAADQNQPEHNAPSTKTPKTKNKKNHAVLKIVALALVCSLLGGCLGSGILWMSIRRGDATSINISARPASAVVLHTVDGSTRMTEAEVYASVVNSVVFVATASSGNSFRQNQTQETTPSGSGFILTQDGYIATNYHVVKGASTVEVGLYNGDIYPATYIGGDEDYDIAVIKIDAENLSPVTLGDSTKLNVGERVLAIGNPLGDLTFTQTGGMVSSVNRTITLDNTPFNMIQTDASINPGNSGGPLLNMYGEVVGIVSAKYTASGSNTVEGLGFAIPINDVFAMIQDIMTNGYITNKPYLGVTLISMDKGMQKQYRYDISEGLFVCSTEKGSAAEKAGLRMGDVITKIDDTPLKTLQDLTIAKKSYSAGDSATFEVYRNGETVLIPFVWDALPEDSETDIADDNSSNNYNYNYPYGGYYSNPWDIFDYFFR